MDLRFERCRPACQPTAANSHSGNKHRTRLIVPSTTVKTRCDPKRLDAADQGRGQFCSRGLWSPVGQVIRAEPPGQVRSGQTVSDRSADGAGQRSQVMVNRSGGDPQVTNSRWIGVHCTETLGCAAKVGQSVPLGRTGHERSRRITDLATDHTQVTSVGPTLHSL